MTTSPSTTSIILRHDVRTEDPQTVRAIVESTGVFHGYEIDIAVELVDERLAKGAASGYEFVFAEEEGESLGYACFGRVPLTVSTFDLYWIATSRRAQGRGVATLLIADVEQLVRASDGDQIFIETSGRDIYLPARTFYQRAGYQRIVEFPDFYAPGDGKVVFSRRVRE